MAASAGRRFIYRSLWLAAALTAIASSGVRAPAQAPPPVQFGLTPLGMLGGAQSAAYGIGYGLGLVGRAQTAGGAYHAFAEGSYGLKDLGTLGGGDSTAFAYGGLVVGQAQTASGAYHAFSYNLATNAKTDLGTLGGNFSAAYGNIGGFTVGASRVAGNTRLRAFEYTNGVMTALPVDTGGDSAARAISTSGDIAGYTCTSGATGCRPFLLTGGTVTLLGASERTGLATGVNSALQVVGALSTGPGTNVMHAFLYSGGVTTDLGTLGGATSEARGIDENGDVVGSAQNAAGQPRAFLWRNGRMIDLNSALVGAPGWVLESAAGILDTGQIVGYGTFQGKRRAFLLTPPVDLEAFIGGSQTQADSNSPHNGIEVGKRVEWVTSAITVGGAPVLTFLGAHMVHTLTGPAVFEDVQSLDGLDKCSVSPTVITCDLGPMEGTGGEIAIHARAIGPGLITHHATVSSTTPDPNPNNNSITETNRAVALSGFTISPATIAGGQVAVGTLTLTDLPPSGDALVTLKSSRPDIAPVPSPFDIPAHASQTRQFHIIPATVSTPTIVQISATYGLVTITKTLTVVPTALRQLYLTPPTAIGGCDTIAGRVLLTGNAPPGGGSVPLTNTNSKAAVPSSVTVPGGASEVRFSVPTSAVTTNASGRVTASFGGVSQTLTLNVRPIRAQTLTLSPNRIRGGGTVSGTVSLECGAAPGAVAISLTSSNTGVASPAVPSITLAAGAISGTFTVKTSTVTAETPVTITASVFGVRKTVTLTVTP
jgi:probable HAF family extracellular repeat protein